MSDGERYSEMGGLAGIGFLINAMSGGGDRGQSFPQSDAEDFSRGARFVPGEVTMARRRGMRVQFVAQCTRCCWYWEFEDGSRIYHWDPMAFDSIGAANGKERIVTEHGSPTFKDGAGPCPKCGNIHTNGGTFFPGEVGKVAHRVDDDEHRKVTLFLDRVAKNRPEPKDDERIRCASKRGWPIR